jgi:putative transposase
MDYRYGSHTVYNIEYHFVWVTKYRYKVLTGDVALRVRELVRQTCDIFEIKILQGVVSKDHVHILVSAPPNMAPSEIMRRIKGRTSSKLFEEFPMLKKRYWGTALLGTRVFLCHSRTDDRRDDPRVSGASLRAGSGGQLSHGVLTTGL